MRKLPAPAADLRRLIRAAGREPVERDTLYNVITEDQLTRN